MPTCEICLKALSTNSTLKKHLQSVHNQDDVCLDREKKSSKCLEENCMKSYSLISQLRFHLRTSHNKLMECEKLYFTTEEEFELWKNNVLKTNNLDFYAQRSRNITYYYCNRSGHHTSKIDNRLGVTKTQELCKINSNCTSQIILSKIDNNKYCAVYHKTHYGHVNNIDDVCFYKEKKTSKCLEENCMESYSLISQLRFHLRTYHKKLMESETLYFTTGEQFELWKNDLCKTNNLDFYSKKSKNCTYYYCNRSGHHKSKIDNRLRATKSQGSCKINSNCTCQIILSKIDTHKYCAVYHKTHYGHDVEIQHIRINKDIKTNVALKLTSGVPVSRILDSFRESIVDDKLSRCDIITRKDINNVKISYNIDIQDGVRHKIDSVSVDLLVKELEGNGDVLLYKKQGEHLNGLTLDDFLLIFMNKVQVDLLQKFGSSVVAIDGTHGLNMYDFEMTSLMVIDEFGEGFPVACMFSNRKDTVVNEFFLRQIKLKAGIILPNVFMSDITEVFYNAWRSTMGEVPHRLYCSWHVDRAWRNNLNKINNPGERREVYKTLKVLQTSLNVADFEKNLPLVMKRLSDDPASKDFGAYFNQYYSRNCHMWAYCYRKNCGINTNMVLESMHKTVKYFYLGGKIVKRLDKGITAVLKYVRDKTVARIIKNTKGFNNSHTQNIHKRHRLALTETFELLENESRIWTLKSKNDMYIVSQNIESCKLGCQIRCSFCEICIHDFQCTCVDFYIRATICKHIHFVNLNFKNELEKSNTKLIRTEDTALCLESLATYCTKESDLLENIKTTANKIALTVDNCRDKTILPQILKQLQNCYNLINVETNVPKSIQTTEPSNKNITKQTNFYSTQKKRKKENKSFVSKPSTAEIKDIQKNFIIHSEHDYL